MLATFDTAVGAEFDDVPRLADTDLAGAGWALPAGFDEGVDVELGEDVPPELVDGGGAAVGLFGGGGAAVGWGAIGFGVVGAGAGFGDVDVAVGVAEVDVGSVVCGFADAATVGGVYVAGAIDALDGDGDVLIFDSAEDGLGWLAAPLGSDGAVPTCDR